LVSCSRSHSTPDVAFDEANRGFVRGDLELSREQAKRGYDQYRKSHPVWAWKFALLEAKITLWQGLFDDVLKRLRSETPPSDQIGLTISRLAILGVANAHTRNFSEASSVLKDATKLCEAHSDANCGSVLEAQGLLASEQSDSLSAERFYQLSLSFARSHHDPFLEATSLLNLGAEALARGRFDEALNDSQSSYDAAKTVDAGIVEQVAQGNIGWAAYRLGDSEKALALFLGAEKTARELKDFVDQGIWLTNAGYVYMDSRNFDLAERSFQQALKIEQEVNSKENIYNALRALARLSLQTQDLDGARLYADRSLEFAKNNKSRLDELYPLLILGQVAARRGDTAGSEHMLHDVERDRLSPLFLKWEAQHSLATLYETKGHSIAADRQYRDAISTFESARSNVQHQDFSLSFLTNGWRIYDDYVHFLLAQGKTNVALLWADHSRARTLAEGLGVLPKNPSAGPSPLNAIQIAQRSRSVILYYWLGERQSYLWAITPQKANMVALPPSAEIDAAVQRYREALADPQDVADYGNTDGLWLYRTLVAPAQAYLSKEASVIVVPDGSLNNLNFETLLAPGPKFHYWIEDATVANASSLRMLAASSAPLKTQARKLLLVGNSVAPSNKYPELARAAAQMESVAGHFPVRDRQIFSREAATPAAYLDSHPEQFTHLHFVAHGTASRLSPLDSAIILSRSALDKESFKLYARDIIGRPLRADLVTISSCYGSGERTFKGEGLVGLSWAFLRAGARNVVAALWEAADTSTEKLMARFYEELDRGASPNDALRTAKLSLLHSEGLRSPFYWAPFQLYTQGGMIAKDTARRSASANAVTRRRATVN
jgi:CHAT domain-containing protein